MAIDYFLTELLISPAQRLLMTLPVRCQSESLELPQGLDFIGAGDERQTYPKAQQNQLLKNSLSQKTSPNTTQKLAQIGPAPEFEAEKQIRTQFTSRIYSLDAMLCSQDEVY